MLWVDHRGHWHVLYHAMRGGQGPGGHAFSEDGITWSNVSLAYGAKRPLAEYPVYLYIFYILYIYYQDIYKILGKPRKYVETTTAETVPPVAPRLFIDRFDPGRRDSIGHDRIYLLTERFRK